MDGKSYADISRALGIRVPKSTLSYWFKDLILPPDLEARLKDASLSKLRSGRKVALNNRIIRRQQHLAQIERENGHLPILLKDAGVARMILATLFLAEGSKRESMVVFCNSDPYVIKLFLHLFRACYRLDEDKFRCTVQCRADQNITELESFWSDITGIPKEKFSKAQVDKRTIGKPTLKTDYKGVCRIDYFSARISYELSRIPKIMYTGH